MTSAASEQESGGEVVALFSLADENPSASVLRVRSAAAAG